MSVIHALSIAGGIYRKEAGVLRIERDVISGHGELDILIQKRGELRARSARLSAEAEGKDAISLPPDLVDQKTNPHFVGIVATERLLFRARRETLQSQVQSIRKRIELNAKEIDSLNAQIEAEQKQFGSVEKELNEVRVMVSRGLAPAPRQLAAERTLAEIEGKQLGLKTLIVRAEQNTSQFEQQIIDLESQFRTGVTIELQQVRMHLIEVERKIATTASLIKEAQDTALETEDVPPDRRSLSYTIIRKGPDGVREFSATEHSDVEPGDVIKVLMGMKSDLAQTGEPAAQASPYRQQAEALRK
jgi:polysaccharide export outer membrane protein/exopolysaccharide production protein ExoF